MTLLKEHKEFGTSLLLVTNISLVTMSPKNFLRHESRGLVVIGFVGSFKIKVDCLLQLAHISQTSQLFITFLGGVLPYCFVWSERSSYEPW